MIKALIFDMDGTVLNTIEDIKNSVNHALKFMGFPQKTVDEIKMAVGNGAKHLIKTVTPKNASQEVIEQTFSIYQKHYDQNNQVFTGPYEDIIDLLKTLKNKGYALAVVSNKYEHLVESLNKEVFNSLFDVSIGEVDGIPIKPAPDMVYKALKLLNVSQDEAVFIGDSDTDILTAQNAHLKVVAVTWGFRDAELLKTFNPNYLINKPKEILNILERDYQL